ncbi:MAG: phytoene/squalene synthase family protein [Ignavibacteriota bacterium]|nr:phytoene/squalene synthase family protein [Ignavibacteriota bacterium]
MQENINTHKEVLDVMKKSKTNFFYSSVFLNKSKSEGLRIIYAFCRLTDDIVDNEELSPEQKIVEIRKWKDRLNNSLNNDSDDEFFSILKEQINIFNIPHKPFFDLIEGMEMDIEKNRYETFDELYRYCYCAASAVGLMTIEIFGYKNTDIKKYAEYLGLALQLTNILRDVKKDALNNRIYIPLEDMKKYNYTETDLMNSVYNDKFRRLMEYEYSRALEYYAKAESFLTEEDKANMIAAEIMGKIYYKLLEKIKSSGFNVYNRSVRISKLWKLILAYSVFIKYKLLYKTH